MFTAKQAERIVDELSYSYESRVREEYFGREVYGARVAIVTAAPSIFVGYVICKLDLRIRVKTIRQDNMGRSATVFY